MLQVIPAQSTTSSAPTFAGFQHHQIQQLSHSNSAADTDVHGELVKQYLTLVAIINNKLIRARTSMLDPDDTFRSEIILDTNEALRMAAGCLAQHFSGPFNRHLGVGQVDAWSRADIVPHEYFAIIKDAIDHQSITKELTRQALAYNEDNSLSTSAPARANPYVLTPGILDELKDVTPRDHPVNTWTGETSFVPLDLRQRAIAELYTAARHSNTALQTALHERGFTTSQLIDLVLHMEQSLIRNAVLDKMHSYGPGVHGLLWQAYGKAIAEGARELQRPRVLDQWMVELIGWRAEVRIKGHTEKMLEEEKVASKKAEEESKVWKKQQEEKQVRNDARKRANRKALQEKLRARAANGEDAMNE